MSTYDKETEAIKAFWENSTSIDEQAARIAELEAQLAAARLLLVAIDENICMSSNPLTITTGRIVDLMRDPASNPWAGLMRAGKEGGAQ